MQKSTPKERESGREKETENTRGGGERKPAWNVAKYYVLCLMNDKMMMQSVSYSMTSRELKYAHISLHDKTLDTRRAEHKSKKRDGAEKVGAPGSVCCPQLHTNTTPVHTNPQLLSNIKEVSGRLHLTGSYSAPLK